MFTDSLVHDELPEYWTQIDHSRVDVLSVSIGAWGDPMFGLDAALCDLKQWDRRFREVTRLLRIERPEDLHTAVEDDRTGILLGFQNSEQFEGDLANVARLAERGVRMVQLTYNDRNAAGSGCTESADQGLTRFGRNLLRELNQVGAIIDVSHCGARTSMEAIELSALPVAVSHAGCAALCSHDRNKSDDLLRLLGERRGFFGICAVPFFLREDGKASLDDIVRHLVHVVKDCVLARELLGRAECVPYVRVWATSRSITFSPPPTSIGSWGAGGLTRLSRDRIRFRDCSNTFKRCGTPGKLP
jgi:membrane dipeptidase